MRKVRPPTRFHLLHRFHYRRGLLAQTEERGRYSSRLATTISISATDGNTKNDFLLNNRKHPIIPKNIHPSREIQNIFKAEEEIRSEQGARCDLPVPWAAHSLLAWTYGHSALHTSLPPTAAAAAVMLSKTRQLGLFSSLPPLLVRFTPSSIQFPRTPEEVPAVCGDALRHFSPKCYFCSGLSVAVESWWVMCSAGQSPCTSAL